MERAWAETGVTIQTAGIFTTDWVWVCSSGKLAYVCMCCMACKYQTFLWNYGMCECISGVLFTNVSWNLWDMSRHSSDVAGDNSDQLYFKSIWWEFSKNRLWVSARYCQILPESLNAFEVSRICGIVGVFLCPIGDSSSQCITIS